MPIGKEEIRGWLERGKRMGASHVIIACDTFDWSDFPVFVSPSQDVFKIAADLDNEKNMTKLMEVYKLDMDWGKQLAEYRARNY